MALSKKNILIAGLPSSGKTTLIKKLAAELESIHPMGFYTEEIRDNEVRKGFRLRSLDGRKGILSHKDIKSHYKVGKYKVDIKGFEEFLDSIQFFKSEVSLIIIDEIGKMECLSNKFKEIIEKLLDSEKIVVATIALKTGGYISDIKRRDDTKVFELTRANRNHLFSEILTEIEKLLT